MTDQENHLYQDLQDLYFTTHSKTEKIKNKFKVHFNPLPDKAIAANQRTILQSIKELDKRLEALEKNSEDQLLLNYQKL